MEKDRIAYLDFVKFVAILLVCVGHCYVMTPDLDSIVRPIIYSFHMPLFMLVCGYFSSRSLEIPIKSLLVKKNKQLLLPVISCTIMTICLFGGGYSYGDYRLCLVSKNSVCMLSYRKICQMR